MNKDKIKLMFIPNTGWVIAELLKEIIGSNEQVTEFKLNNPCILADKGQSIAFIPLMAFSTETELSIKPAELLGGKLFQPTLDLVETYSKQFSPIITAPSNLILN